MERLFFTTLLFIFKVMARAKKDSEYLSMRIDKKISDKIEEVCQEVGLTKIKVVEKAVEKFYDEYKKTGKV